MTSITPVKERPILFSGSMVRAILNGSKTQTRRLVKPQPSMADGTKTNWSRVEAVGLWFHIMADKPQKAMFTVKNRYGQPGDRLIVKEHAWMWCEKQPNGTTEKGRPKFKYVPARHAKLFYCADHPEKPTISPLCSYRGWEWGWRKKLGRFLPKWASRITLEITAVRVERLQEISAEDALAEGINHYTPGVTAALRGESEANPVEEYRTLWESINGPGSWQANPWVWVVEFKRITP